MRYVLVSGAARGIGNALAEVSLKRGDFVVAGVRRLDSPKVVALKEQYPDRFQAVEMDVASTELVARGAEAIRKIVPHLDIMINNAAIQASDKTATLDDFNVDNCLESFNVNSLGALRVIQQLYPLLEKGETKLIVNISSNAASIADTDREKMFAYCMSKAALNMGSKIVQSNLYRKGIKVLAMHPGWVRTDSGGPDNPLSPEESATAILDTAGKYRDLLNGPMYVDYTGKVMNY